MESLARHHAGDIHYLARDTSQRLLCFIDNGDKFFITPGGKTWLTKNQAKEWVLRRGGRLLAQTKDNSACFLKTQEKTIAAARDALSAAILESEAAIERYQENGKSKSFIESKKKDLAADEIRLATIKIKLLAAAQVA